MWRLQRGRANCNISFIYENEVILFLPKLEMELDMYVSRRKNMKESRGKLQKKKKTQESCFWGKSLKRGRIFSIQLSRPFRFWGDGEDTVGNGLHNEKCPFQENGVGGDWKGGEGRESSDHSRHNPSEQGTEGNQTYQSEKRRILQSYIKMLKIKVLEKP